MGLVLLFNGDVTPTPPPPPINVSTFEFHYFGGATASYICTLEDTALRLDTNLLEFSPEHLSLTLEGDDIRVSWDGSNPTAVEGHRLYSGEYFTLSNFHFFDLFTMHSLGSSTVRLLVEGL